MKLPQWLKSNVFYRAKIKTNSGDPWENNPCVAVHPHDANLVSSENGQGDHFLMLDLDSEHWYHESSTEGHAHLVIRKYLELSELKEIVNVLVKYGILEEGVKRQLDERGCLTLRMPGMKKGVKEDNMSLAELELNGIKVNPVEEKDVSQFGGPVFKYNTGGFVDDIKDFFSI